MLSLSLVKFDYLVHLNLESEKNKPQILKLELNTKLKEFI